MSEKMTKMWNEIWEQPLVLERCVEHNGPELKKLLDAIAARQINQVLIAARGTSDHAAVYGKYIIELLTGVPTSLAAPSVFTIYGKTLHLKNALVIGISQSGMAADVLEVLQGAKAAGALTVGITNDKNSDIAKEVMHHLSCEAGPEKSVAATKTFSAQLMLLAQLAAGWASDKALLKELETVPERISHTFEAASIIEENVARYRFMEECFVLARGLNYAVALEAALKIQETNYVRAKAFATSDFMHGPIAMIERDIPVIIFAPNGPSLEDVSQMIERLRASQIELLVVSNNPDVRAKGACSFPIPPTDNDMISPFFNTVVAQMFACKLSLAKGLDPDSPRGLKKVTITK